MSRSRLRIQASSRQVKSGGKHQAPFKGRRLRYESLEDRRVLAVLTVDNGGDLTNGDTSSIEALLADDGGDGVSLREALEAANATPGTDEVLFQSELSGSTIALRGEELVITDPVTIDATGLSEPLIIDAQGLSRVIYAGDSSGDVTLAGLTITGGRTTAEYSEGGGAGIHHRGESLSILSSQFLENRTEGRYAGGGAVLGNSVTIESSFLTENSTVGYQASGGAVSASTLTIRDSELVGNHTVGEWARGGAISSSRLDVDGSTFESNYTLGDNASGGAIRHLSSPARISNTILTGNYTDGTGARGGAIGSTGYGLSDFVIEDSIITANHTKGDGAHGGGLSTSTRLQLLGSKLLDNWTEGSGAVGGGLSTDDDAYVFQSVLRGNSTSGNQSGGGGASFGGYSGQTRVVASEISGNYTTGSSSGGGGIQVGRGSHSIERSTISGNTTSGPGSSGGGLGISSFQGTVTIAQSTVTQNSASNEGGEAGGLWLSSVDTTITGSIVASNTAGSRYDDVYAFTSGFQVEHSLIGDGDGTSLVESFTPDANGNLIGSSAGAGPLDPGLGPLAGNGGPTQTHEPLPSSPAIDAGDPVERLRFDRFDQRGEDYLRVLGGRIDIGSVETQLKVLVVDKATDEFDGNYTAGDFSLREAIHLANETPGRDLIAFAPGLSGATLPMYAGELAITETLVIDASSLPDRFTIDAQNRSRIFSIEATAGDILLRGVNLIRGSTANHDDPLTDSGGAIRSESDGVLQLVDSTIAESRTTGYAAYGGAIFSTGNLVLSQATLSGNRTEGARSPGGAIAAYGTVLIEQSTVVHNQALAEDSAAGGVWVSSSGSLELNGSIVAANASGGSADDLSFGFGSFAADYSLVGDVNGASGTGNALLLALAAGEGNLFSTVGKVAPGVAPLADNGGGALTHSLEAGSHAINAGDPDRQVAGHDQRGAPFARVAEGRIDLGPYESQSLTLVVDSIADAFDSDYSAGQLTLREAVALANSNPGFDTVTFASALSGQSILLTDGEIEVSDDLIINGAGLDETLIVSGQDASRVFNFTAETGDFTIERIVVTAGRTTGNNPNPWNVEDPITTHSGGAIRFDSLGRLTLREATVSDSRTTGRYATGGGVFARGSVELIDSTLSGNATLGSSGHGGGLWALGKDVIIDNSLVVENYTSRYGSSGGGIGSDQGDITITGTELRGNYTREGGSLGGAVYGDALIVIEGSTLHDNSVKGQHVSRGGAVFGSRVEITRSVLSQNYNMTYFGLGGAVSADHLTASESTFRGNYALGDLSQGGAIYAYGLVLQSTTLAENRVEGQDGRGGAISVGRGISVISDSTISGNRVVGPEGRGGAVYHSNDGAIDDGLKIERSTITANRAMEGGGVWSDDPTLRIEGSILAANTAIDGAPDLHLDAEPDGQTLRYSLLGDNAGTPFAEAPSVDEHGNFIGSSEGVGVIDPLIGPLADNGGLTHTHAILPGSIALEAGDPQAPSVGYDQRGEPFDRVSGRRIDLGAYEALTLIVDNAIDESDGDHSFRDLSLREAIDIANAAPGIDFVLFAPELSGRTILLDGQQLEISDAIAIDAGTLEEGLTIDAQSRSRVLKVSENSGDVALTGLKITGGRLVGESYEQNPYGWGVSSDFDGGGIGSFTNATLELSGVTITGNRVEGYRVQGGGVFAAGPIELTSSVVSNNSTTGREATGGGLHVGGAAYVYSSSIERNSTDGLSASGGGLYATGDVELIESSIADNLTQGDRSEGGGIATLGDLRSTASELTRNHTVGLLSGGGAANVAGSATFRSSLIRDNWTEGGDSPGGGIHAGVLGLTQSTVSGNFTLGDHSDGGGVFSAGELTASQSTVVDNHTISSQSSGGGIASEGGISLDGTVVATNTSGGEAPDLWTMADFGLIAYSFVGDRAGTVLVGSHSPDVSGNLIGDSEGSGVINPRLGPLVPSGGSLPAHRPLSGSPLIDTGDPAFDPYSVDPPIVGDFRGPLFSRISGGRVDIGAVEEVGLIVVDTLSDTIDGDRSSGELSIREAAELANANPGQDTITFDTSLSGGTILLTEGELLFIEAVTIDATDLESELTIDAQSQSRVIHLETYSGDSTLAGVHLTNGLINRSNSFILPFVKLHDGGAIRSLSTGDLTLDRTRVTNSASTGGYIDGGGIYARGLVVLTGSEVSGNRASGYYSHGGGISAPRVEVLDSLVTDNSTSGHGGGISGGAVSIERSTLSGNAAGAPDLGSGYGDGGAVNAQQLTIVGSSVLDNSAHYGGGLSTRETLSITDSLLAENVAWRQGGAVQAIGSLSVSTSTFSENQAVSDSRPYYGTAYGGSISLLRGEAVIQGSTIYGNEASAAEFFQISDGKMLVENSILTGSRRTAARLLGDAELIVNNSLIDSRIQPTSGENNTVQDNALLGPLEDNGGPTPTHLPLPGSPAIDAGDASIAFDPLEFDQRGEGYFRVAGTRVDRGAVEIQAVVPDLPGDFNQDGVVDTADYTVWRDTLGDVIPPYAGADADGDAEITQADYEVWRANFGSRSVQPEPIDSALAFGASESRSPVLITLLKEEETSVDSAFASLGESRKPFRTATRSMALRTRVANPWESDVMLLVHAGIDEPDGPALDVAPVEEANEELDDESALAFSLGEFE